MVAGGDYADWTAPQAHADAIAATGAPPLTLFNGIANNLTSLPAGFGGFVPNFFIVQPSYEVFINAFETGAGAAGPLEIRMQWYEDTGTTFIDQQSYWVWPGTTTLTSMLCGKGPTRGGLLSISLINHSAAMSYDVHTWLYQRSHFYTRDDWRHTFFTASASGLAIPANEPVSGLICQTGPVVAANSNSRVQLPLYTGQVQIYADTTSNTTDMTLRFQNNSNLNASALGTRTQLIKSDANGRISATLQLPRYQWDLEIDNGNAAAQTCQVWINTME